MSQMFLLQHENLPPIQHCLTTLKSIQCKHHHEDFKNLIIFASYFYKMQHSWEDPVCNQNTMFLQLVLTLTALILTNWAHESHAYVLKIKSFCLLLSCCHSTNKKKIFSSNKICLQNGTSMWMFQWPKTVHITEISERYWMFYTYNKLRMLYFIQISLCSHKISFFYNRQTSCILLNNHIW